MIDPRFIPTATDDELAQASATLDLLIKAHYTRLGDITKKLSPMPTINPATLELKLAIDTEIANRIPK